MSLDDAISLLLRELSELPKERNPEKLQEWSWESTVFWTQSRHNSQRSKSTANQQEEDVFFRYSGWFRSSPLLDSSGAPSHHQC